MPTVAERIESLQRDFMVIESGQGFQQIGGDVATKKVWSEARALANLWLGRIKGEASKIDEPEMQPVFVFANALMAIGNGEGRRQNESAIDAIRRVKNEFQTTIPLLAFAIFEASGLLSMSETKMSKWKDETIREVNASVDSGIARFSDSEKESIAKIRESADEAEKDFEAAKAKASKISIDSAQAQFQAAARSFARKLLFWSVAAGLLFAGLVLILWWLLVNPPTLVREITDALRPGSHAALVSVPIPLLVVTSAYFTGIRLAIIGVLGFGLAFSLRMARAYIHMIEHNQHKLRVTNSIEAFVAAVRTPEQKDLVLSKLVESVTEFGDSGILAKQGDGAGFPSVIFEAMTKNVGKAD